MANRIQTLLQTVMPAITPTKEMGVSGTTVHGGFISTVERTPKWIGRERYRTAADIATNISIVAASTRYFLNLIANPEWSVKPADEDSPAAVELADFVDDVLHDTFTPLPNIVRRAGMYQFHGFGIQEWTAKKRQDGLIGFSDIESRPQHTIHRWAVEENGKVIGLFQRSPQTGEELPIPRGKVIYLVDDTFSDSPEGLGIFRNLLEPFTRLERYLKLEAKAFERDLRGIPVGRAPIAALNALVAADKIKKEDAEEMLQSLQDFVELQVKEAETSIVLDSKPYVSTAADGPKVSGVREWDIDLLQGDGSGLAELNVAIERIQREMARLFGTENLMMGDKGGARALSEDKSRNLYLIASSVLHNISSAFQNDLLTPLWILNGFDEELMPQLITEDISFKDVNQITASLRDMAAAGAILAPDDPAINDVRDLLGVSRQSEDLDAFEDATTGGARNNPDQEVEEEDDEDLDVEE